MSFPNLTMVFHYVSVKETNVSYVCWSKSEINIVAQNFELWLATVGNVSSVK
jgi:hypothetical protein